MAKIGIPHFWKSLRWTIMLKFLAASILTWFIGTQMGILFEYNELCSNSQPEKIAAEIAPTLTDFSAQVETKNLAALNLQMRELAARLKTRQRRIAYYFFHNVEQKNFPNKRFAEIFVLDSKSEIIQNITAKYQEITQSAQPLNEQENAMIRQALLGSVQIAQVERELKNLLVIPLKSIDNNVLGVIFVREETPFTWTDAATKAARDFLTDLSQFWMTLAICGFIFGFLQAHRITKRFEQIAVAAESWSKGDFSARAPEHHADELGGLSTMLNRMTTSLREVFRIKQNLAMSEERNRIARDLHDSVKQQIFGLGMQIGAAKAILKNNPEAVENRLTEAENLVRQVQAELVDLIRELRPQTEEDLCERVENYLQTWSRQNGISADCFLVNDVQLPQTIENTLFRIIQEALANAAKHSHADKVTIELERISANYCLVIEDNGIGFDQLDKTRGIGLKTMQERAETLKNGRLKIESGKGVQIRVEFER